MRWNNGLGNSRSGFLEIGQFAIVVRFKLPTKAGVHRDCELVVINVGGEGRKKMYIVSRGLQLPHSVRLYILND